MKLRKNIQKIGALAGSGLMATLSVASPVAADLGDLPQPFIQDGEFDGNLVVGEEAQTEDVLGAIDIASSFQAEATSPVSVGGGGSVTVQGGEDFQEYVGSSFTPQTLDDSDLEGFADTDVDDNDYDYTEELDIAGSSDNRVAASAFTTYSEDENYAQDAYMELGQSGMNYSLNFEDPVPKGAFDDDDMEVEFLGRQVEVEDIGNTSDEVTIQTSDEYTLEVGDSVEVDDHTVTLERVGESSVLVDVDGQQKALQYGESDSDNDATFDQADDFEVVVDSAFYEDGASNNLAVLELGTDNTETYQDGDALEIFGGSDEDDEATYVWDITTESNDELEELGVRLNLDHDRVRDSPDEDERNAIPLEGELELPNNRAALQFQGWDDTEMEDYEDVSLDIVNEEFSSVEYANATAQGSNSQPTSGDFLQLTTDDQVLDVTAGDSNTYEAEEVYFYADGTDFLNEGETQEDDVAVYFDDGDDEYFAGWINDDDNGASDVSVNLDISDDSVPFQVFDDGDIAGSNDIDGVTSGANFSMPFDSGGSSGPAEELQWNLTVSNGDGFAHFGPSQNDDAEDFTYRADLSDTSSVSSVDQSLSGSDDEARRTAYGVTWDDAEGMVDSDEFDFSVPAAAQEANLIVRSTDTQISEESGSDSGAVEVNRIPVGLGVLDSDVVSNGEVTAEGPHIVVGGPYANTAASALLGNPSSSEIEQMFSPGQATIRMFNDEQALLVAGYNPQDTVRASRVVADYQDYSEELTGSEVELVFDGSEDIEFQAPSMNGSQ